MTIDLLIFQAPSYSHFHLNLDYLRLDCSADDRLTIRDGISVYSPLIALLNNETISSPLIGILTTSSPQLLIEFNITRKPSISHSKCVAGFVTSITSGIIFNYTLSLITFECKNLDYLYSTSRRRQRTGTSNETWTSHASTASLNSVQSTFDALLRRYVSGGVLQQMRVSS